MTFSIYVPVIAQHICIMYLYLRHGVCYCKGVVTFYAGIYSDPLRTSGFGSHSMSSGRNNFPIEYLDVMLHQVFLTDIVKSVDQASLKTFHPTSSQCKHFDAELVGSYINMMQTDEFISDEMCNFNTIFSNKDSSTKPEHVFFCMQIQRNAIVTEKAEMAGLHDLVLEGKPSKGLFRLVPKLPNSWGGHTTTEANGISYLRKRCFHESNVIEFITKGYKRRPVYVIAFSILWPSCAKEWICRYRPSQMLNKQAVEKIHKAGCHAVPYNRDPNYSEIICDQTFADNGEDDTLWALSFAVAEKEYCRYITVNQRLCFLLLTNLLHESILKHKLPHCIASHLFFYACDNLDKCEWEERPGRCILVLLKRLFEGFRKMFLPHYFIANKNLLEHFPRSVVTDVFEVLSCHLCNPLWAIYKALHICHVPKTDFGSLAKNICLESTQYILDCEERAHEYTRMIPAFQDYWKKLISCGKYKAMFPSVAKFSAVENRISIEEITRGMLSAYNQCNQWGICLYFDLQAGTSLTRTEFYNTPCIHISEVFGDKATEMLLDTCLPEQANIAVGDLMYPKILFKILNQCGKEPVILECLTFYLRKYIEIAGDCLVIQCANKQPKYTYQQPGDPSIDAIGEIYNIHTCVFNTCRNLLRLQQYREFLPHLENVVAVLDDEFYYQNLEIARSCVLQTI